MTTRRRRGNSDSDQVQGSFNYSIQELPIAYPLVKDIHKIMPRDRTAEFNSAVRSLQGRQIARAVQVRDVKKVKALQSYGEFMMIAKSVGLNISNTYAKLEKLTLRKCCIFITNTYTCSVYNLILHLNNSYI